MTEHDARDAQTPEDRMRGELYELPNEIWDRLAPSQCNAILNTAIRAACEAADAARAEGKAEGAAEEFKRGYLIACCNIVNFHDEPCIAADVLMEENLTEADVADLSEYDAKALRKIRKARPDDPIRARSEGGDSE